MVPEVTQSEEGQRNKLRSDEIFFCKGRSDNEHTMFKIYIYIFLLL